MINSTNLDRIVTLMTPKDVIAPATLQAKHIDGWNIIIRCIAILNVETHIVSALVDEDGKIWKPV